jgi:NADH:ubiquinone oxidoreductase subunit H
MSTQMNRPATWALIAFFFLGGLAFTIFDETRWIGIGQIWMLVAVVLAFFAMGGFGKLREKLRR